MVVELGTQALEVCRLYPDLFKPEVLTASENHQLLIEQALEFLPNAVVIGNKDKYTAVREALSTYPVKVFSGEDAIAQVTEMGSVDMVLMAIVGFAGLKPTLHALRAGKDIAIANKETFVVAGEIVQKLAYEHRCALIPVDSEHSAIFQCLVGEDYSQIEKIILTASGGPFRGANGKDLHHVTREQALKHPNWEMGAKITIDSASMMNKGLEVIEAHWLFGIPASGIEVVIHPQSIIHSMVQFRDGSIKAQMGLPDMKLPIQYALSYPVRLQTPYPRFDFARYPSLTFETPDTNTFRNLALAYQALEKGGNMPCILNAANEVAVAAFLDNKVSFPGMSDLISRAMDSIGFIRQPGFEDYVETDRETRAFVHAISHQ
ncbi:MAG: 1-deoxy-D-xylulose-5-phosphate reductoisomerase [Bacteroidales bacterium]